MYPEDYLFTEEHEWVRLEEDQVVIGVSHFAQEELGEVVYVDLPQVGQTFSAGDEIGTIESVKTVADLFTPVAGEVVEVNEALDEAPEKVNEDPHGEGWLVTIRFTSSDELESLMNAEAYGAFAHGD